MNRDEGTSLQLHWLLQHLTDGWCKARHAIALAVISLLRRLPLASNLLATGAAAVQNCR